MLLPEIVPSFKERGVPGAHNFVPMTKQNLAWADMDDSSSVASIPESLGTTDIIRYVTCVVYSTLDRQQLIDATPRISNAETKVLWVPANRYQPAVRTDGVIYRKSESQEAVELQDWDPDWVDTWFASRYISRLVKKSKAATGSSVKILLVQPKGDTKWSLPYRLLENDDIPKEVFVDCVHSHVPHIALQVHNVITDNPKEFSDDGVIVEVNPCFYEWVGEIDMPSGVTEDQLSAASSSHSSRTISYASEETVPVPKRQIPVQMVAPQVVQGDAKTTKSAKRSLSKTLQDVVCTDGSEPPTVSVPIQVPALTSTNQSSSVEVEEPFYNYIIGLVLTDINHDDLPFASQGTRKRRAMYCSPTSGHEFCWVSVHELIRALSPLGNMEVRHSDGRHPKLPLIRQSTKEMDEAYYALRSLVRYQEAHEELHIDPKGQSTLPQLLVLMKRMSGTATWSLLTEEFVSGRDVSRINTFVNMAKFQLPPHIQYEYVNDQQCNER